MHTFTRQQRQGGVKFAPKTLVGNWSEDLDLLSASMKDFLLRKQNGSLKLDHYQERLQVALEPVEMSRVRSDAYVHFGDVLQLMHLNTRSLLAVDVEDKDPRAGELTCAASVTSELLQPVARNTLLISKYVPSQATPLEPQWADDVLHYGQKIRLLANPMAQGELIDARGGHSPLALFSRPLGVTCAAKYSRHQLVGFTWAANSYDSVWQVAAIDPADRLASEGVEVAAGAPLLLIHCATQVPLNVEEGVARPNSFGIETEVTAHAVVSSGKQLSLEHAARGETSRCLPKAQLSSNHWAFVTGDVVAKLPAINHSTVGGLDRLLSGLHEQLNRRTGALASLNGKLVSLADANGRLPTQELVCALWQLGCELSEDDGADIATELAAQQSEMQQQSAAAEAAAATPGTHTTAGNCCLTRVRPSKVNVQAFMQALAAAANTTEKF